MSIHAPGRRWTFPVSLRLERRLSTPRWLLAAMTAGAIVVALLISGLLIAVIGADPVHVFQHILSSAFGDVGVLSDTLVQATPLIFTGLACALAFRMRMWNIGAEGQLLFGAWGASAVVLIPLVPVGTSPFIVVPLMVVAGFAAGALWGGIAGWLKARFDVNEIITTLMLNYIAIQWVRYWVFGPWSEGGFQQSKQFPREAWLPRLTDFSKLNPDLGGLTVHVGFLIALVCAVLVWLLLSRTRLGYEIRLIGDNRRAARYAGMNIGRTMIVVMLISGGLAGLAGMSQVAGASHRLQDGLATGAGFTGVIIAYLARFNPFGVVIAAICFGALTLAGREIQPAGIPTMIQGILLFCVICSDIFLRFRVRVVTR